MKILIVEDDALIALFIKEAVERLGHTLLAVFDRAEDVLASLQEQRPDVVLMDIEIKGNVDGIQCAKALQIKHDIPSIFVTSHQQSEVIQEAMDVKPLGFLIKPIQESHIEASLALAQIALQEPTLQSEANLGDYSFNFEHNTLRYQGGMVKLGKNELQLLALLFKNLNNTVSSQEIMRHIWNKVLESDESLRQLIYRTRKKVPYLQINSSSKVGYALSQVL